MTDRSETGVDRRTTLAWVAATLGTAPLLAACGPISMPWSAPQLLGVPQPITGKGYGTDPNLASPEVPWQKTMTQAQLGLVAALSDLVLPGMPGLPPGNALGVPDFIDEWVSAPYANTMKDREDFFALFEWLEGEARAGGSPSFASADTKAKSASLDRIAWKDRVEKGLEDHSQAFSTFRRLSTSAYLASEEGTQWLGYKGNQPSVGDYAGPTDEALAHLNEALRSRSLKVPPTL